MNKNDLKYFTKLKQKKYRDSENKFLIEGDHLIEECINSEFYKNNLEKVFIRNGFKNEIILSKIKSSSASPEIISLDENKFNQLTETINSQGIVGIVSKAKSKIHTQSSVQKLTVSLDSVNDPGNLGTILRSCYWFGVNEILIGNDSVELYNSKVIRSSQGALFNLNIKEKVDMVKELEVKFNEGFRIMMTDLNSEKFVHEIKFNKYEFYIFVFGNESKGINKKILENKNYDSIRIKGFSDCESLNISVAVGIVLNEFRVH